jgi:hypothetical protein
MFKVKIDEDEYKVVFRHYAKDTGAQELGTACYIEKNKGDYYIGSTVLSAKDKYNKRTGRKLALGRALKLAFPDAPNTRKLFWDAYKLMQGGKW